MDEQLGWAKLPDTEREDYATFHESAFFIENIVKPYIKIVEGLMAEG